MFVRYLGGGIGHLEQFPPASNNDKDTTHENNSTEAEADDFITTDISGDDDSDNEDEDEEREVEDDDSTDEDEDLEMEERLDEETGNVY